MGQKMDEQKKDISVQQTHEMLRRKDAPWEACPIEEKIERLRQELRGLRWTLNDLHRCTASLEEHAHDARGEIVVPLRRKYDENVASGRDLLA